MTRLPFKPYRALTLVLILTSGFSTPVSPDMKDDWCYSNMDCDQFNPISDWNKGVCKTGEFQSPINLNISLDEVSNNSIVINWSESRNNYDFTHFQMKNNGKTVSLTDLKSSSGQDPTFTCPERNNSVYKLDMIDFHWGAKDDEGSEHGINDQVFSMEMHLVHYRVAGGVDDGYTDLAAAIKSGVADALSMIAIFLKVGRDNPTSALEPVISNFRRIPNVGDRISLEDIPLNLSDIVKVLNKAITYSGSLTTPTCDEVVAWLVGTEPVYITQEDLKAFRELIKEPSMEPLLRNYRRFQEANGRPLQVIRFSP